MKVKISCITIPPDRQRRKYSEAGIQALAASMAKRQINPITVEESGVRESDGEKLYTLIAGERRLAAARFLGWQEIEAQLMSDLSELEREEIELDENLMRENLTWQEEVDAKRRILEVRSKLYDESIEDVADHIGASRGGLWEDANLAKAMEVVPELREAKNKTQALTKLRLLTRRVALQAKAAEAAAGASPSAAPEDSFESHVHLGDCVELMSKWPDEILHCVITDPPYGMNLDVAGTKKDTLHPAIYDDSPEDILELYSKAASQCFRLLKPSTHAYFFFDIKLYYRVLTLLTKAGFVVDPVPLIWAKNRPGQTNHPESRWASAYEVCFFCRKPSLTGAHRALLVQGQANLLKHNVVEPSKKIHPTEKPVDLLKQLIETSTAPGEVILDCFGGSGSLGEAAVATGRNFILIEKDPAYYAGILERLKGLKS
jgi:ParB/RepB/Spo0J family partition protein